MFIEDKVKNLRYLHSCTSIKQMIALADKLDTEDAYKELIGVVILISAAVAVKCGVVAAVLHSINLKMKGTIKP